MIIYIIYGLICYNLLFPFNDILNTMSHCRIPSSDSTVLTFYSGNVKTLECEDLVVNIESFNEKKLNYQYRGFYS